jgi:signal transduction histidine kinase/ligand-binding sensor domain-containing protein
LWIATDVGLDRYDSYQFRKYYYTKDKPGSISGGMITDIFEDSRRNLWIGTTRGLNLYDRTKDNFKVFHHKQVGRLQDSDFINSIAEDNEGNLWTVTGGNCLNRWIPETGGFESFPFDSMTFTGYPVPTQVMDFDSSGNIWITGSANILFRFDLRSRRDNLGINAFKNIYIDPDEKIWIGTNGNGLFSFDPATGVFVHFNARGDGTGTNNRFILDVFPENDRYLLFATDHGGINRFDRVSRKFEYLTYNSSFPQGLNNPGVSCLYKDKEGILWAGTTGGGVNYNNPKKERFMLFRHNNNNSASLVYDLVSTFFEDHEGKIWIGTDGGGLSIFNPQKESFRHFVHETSNPAGLSGNAISSIREDKDRDIWIASWDGGVDRYDRRTGKFEHYTFGHGTDIPAVGLQIDKDGRIWVAFLNREVIQYDKIRGVIARYNSDTAHDLPFGDVISIVGSDNGDIWMTSQNGLIHRIFQTGEFKLLKFPDNSIMAFFNDSEGNIWVGSSSSGIYYCRPDGTLLRHFTSADGLPDNFIRGITSDSQKNIWISTNNGLSRFDAKKRTFRNYSVEDGLQGTQFHYQSVLRTRDGKIYFGGSNGFNSFYPDSLEENKVVPKIYLTDFQIFNKPVIYTEGGQFDTLISEASAIRLTWKQSVFSFAFSAINYTTPEKNHYAYIMEGFDKEWNHADASRRYVTYTNLDPGSYVFRVIASNNDQHWNKQGISLRITILPPWWKALWVRTLAIIILVSVLLAGYLFRIRQLKKLQQRLKEQVDLKTTELSEKNTVLRSNLAERDKFFSIIAHDLRNPLSSIVGFSGLLIKQTDKEHQASQYKFAMLIQSAAERMYNLLNNLLEWAGTQQGLTAFQPVRFNLSEILEEEMDVLHGPAEEKNIRILTTLSDKLELEGDRNMMKTILRNLVNNAIKYTYRGGFIEIGAFRTDSHVEIYVRDNGMGMDKSVLNSIFTLEGNQSMTGTENEKGTGLGLILCKTFVEKHKGTITAESGPGAGSVFRVRLPVRR